MHVKPEEVTMYLTFLGRRITSDFRFVHAPPPRHTLLAWPATEEFDALPKLAHEPIRTEAPNESLSQGASVLLGSGPLSPKIVICTMFRNEGLYLEEWLKYHLLLGVSKVSAFIRPKDRKRKRWYGDSGDSCHFLCNLHTRHNIRKGGGVLKKFLGNLTRVNSFGYGTTSSLG